MLDLGHLKSTFLLPKTGFYKVDFHQSKGEYGPNMTWILKQQYFPQIQEIWNDWRLTKLIQPSCR